MKYVLTEERKKEIMVTGKCNRNAFARTKPILTGKSHDNELSTRLSNDLVDLLNLAHAAPMITEVRDAHTL